MLLVDRWQMCSLGPGAQPAARRLERCLFRRRRANASRTRSADTLPSFIWAPSVQGAAPARAAPTPSKGLDVFEGASASLRGRTHMPSSVRIRGGVRHAADVGGARPSGPRSRRWAARGFHADSLPGGQPAQRLRRCLPRAWVLPWRTLRCNRPGLLRGCRSSGFGCLVAGLTQVVWMSTRRVAPPGLPPSMRFCAICGINVLCDAANHAVLDEDVGDL